MSYCSARRPPEWTRKIYARLSKAITTASLRRSGGTTGSSPTRTATQPSFTLVILTRTRTTPSVRFERRLNWLRRWLHLRNRTPLQTRVGIATGLVVVGDMSDAGGMQQHGIIGETPSLAARLQAIAEPGTVVIAESTRKLLGNLFELEDLGTKGLQGIAAPVRAWAALRPSAAASRFEALHGTGLTALVGREEELELLLRRWSRAKAGEGQVVLLSGEAGIGKSRLTAALLEVIAPEPHTRLRNFCSPQHTDSALHPTIGQIERAAGFARDDGLRAKLDKLDALLAQSSTSPRDAALFAEMLSLANDGRYPTLELSPSNAVRKRWRRWSLKWRSCPGSIQCYDFRGCAMDRPHQPGTIRSYRGQGIKPPRVADRDVQAGV